ncbi:hypothetical protein phytr_140 [Candidatus Phycorickettsia trachydisci]|uniref:Uncharacterized protein n=1 Tax=Candidatus Phycorickettsia trachydisci TaxID=2115978 RepID=A0A2P1P6U0_9RICK|nr:hypothetical protein [Candidatus Phycorickettsia trachydisci]AVP86978.1 hypothetical protein phytr_140 [Candidatus Phycorickettsia trachydisci]
MSDNNYSQAKIQIITDEAEAKTQVTTQVVEYLRSPEARANFTAGHLEKAIEAVENSNDIAGLNGVVQDFVDVLGPKSIKALENNPKKIKELANSAARAIISQVKPNEQGLKYNKQQHEAALLNFKKLDKSKFDLDSIGLGTEITDMLIQNADTLQASRKLKPHLVGTILATQLVEHDEVEGKKEVIVALAAGMIAKVTGQQTPFKEDLSKKGVPPYQVINAIVSAAVDIANKPEYSNLGPEQAMMFGKQLGKNTRDELYQNKMSNSDSLAKILTSKHRDSYKASIVPPTIIQQLASSLRPLKRSRTISTPRPNTRQKTGPSL